jgi:hypothetical protein
MTAIGSDILQQWQTVLAEIVARPRPPPQTTTASGAVLLGKGLTADVWGFSHYAIKLFRHRYGISVPDSMAREIATYERLESSGKAGGLPRLYEYGLIDGPHADPNVYGWAKFSRVPGHPLSYDELSNLTTAARALWVQGVVSEAVKMETALGEVQPLPSWHDDYTTVRIKLIRKRAETPGQISSDDLTLADELGSIIASMTISRKFIHGDFNPPNIIADISRIDSQSCTITFVDPLINYDAPEANWRQLTLLPELSDALAAEYTRQTGFQINNGLMYAIGAMTHLYMAIVEPENAEIRRLALVRCVERITQ